MGDPLARLSELLDEAEQAGHAGVSDSAYAAVTKTARLASSVLREAIALARAADEMRKALADVANREQGSERRSDVAFRALGGATARFEAAVAAGLGEG